jgi:hypothetical protein
MTMIAAPFSNSNDNFRRTTSDLGNNNNRATMFYSMVAPCCWDANVRADINPAHYRDKNGD